MKIIMPSLKRLNNTLPITFLSGYLEIRKAIALTRILNNRNNLKVTVNLNEVLSRKKYWKILPDLFTAWEYE